MHIQDADNCAIKGLVINGFSLSGISINGTGAVNNRVNGCFIGTDEKGAAAVANGNGIVITDGAHNNLIGGGNLISGNGYNGIVLAEAGVSDNRVQGNAIGLNLAGDAALGNARHGILITNGAQENVIGGMTSQLDGNVISGNGEDGVHLSGEGTNNNVVRNSCIGGDRNCTGRIPNGGDGVEISAGAQGNEVGDATNDLGNAIFGNGGNGVLISDDDTTLNKVQRCAIGTNPNNETGVGNLLNGVLIANGASNNLIGGPGTNQGCVISGNGQNGVHLTGASNNVVQGNFIGTNISGTASLSNAQHGVLMDNGASNNQIGGATTRARNVISGNTDGVSLVGNTTTGNVVQGNRIAHNGLDGVAVGIAPATQNRILSNLIYDNGGLGINLIGGVEDVFGVTANDPSDADASPNKLQNFPVLTLAATDGNFTTINGSLDSDPANAAYPVLIQFFISNVADPSGFGEGKALFASHLLNAPGNFSLNNLPSAPVGAILRATDSDGNTSEFSQAIPVSAMSAGVAHLSIGATPSVVEVNGEAIIEVQATNSVGNAVSNANVVFQTTGGTLNANADTTDANGRAKVILRQVPFGATTVTAETGSVRVTVEVRGVLRLRVPAGVSLLSFPVDVAAGQVGELFRRGAWTWRGGSRRH